jgi:D-alanine transaminase
MAILANWNGSVMPLEDVKVSVLDRAFMFGDSIYEVIRIYGGRAWRLNDHLERLATGLAELKIDFDAGQIGDRIDSLLKSTQLKDALAYVQVTRGAAPRHHYFPSESQPNCLIYVEPFLDLHASARQVGGKAITYPDVRWMRNDIKATTLLANCMAANAAHEKGCIESILVKNGMISEGSHTSVFGVIDNKVIVSPSSSSVLPGITKKQVIELCTTAGITMQEGYLPMADVPKLQELFITATPEEIIGIVQLDETIIRDGKPGPITGKLQQEFRRTIDAWLAAEVH